MITLSSDALRTGLSDWQKKQAAMLYHYASLDCLKYLHRMVTNFIDGVIEPVLTSAKNQNRDSTLTNSRWGTRDTSENWSNNAWPFLKDLQRSLAKDIADRAFETYRITDTNNCVRGIEGYSMAWATADEELKFTDLVRIISAYALYID